MPRKDYNKMYGEKKAKVEGDVLTPAKIMSEETTPVEEVVEKKGDAPTEKKKEVKADPKPKKVAPKKRIGTVTGGLNLNVRKTPGGEVVGCAAPDSKVDIVGEEGDWYKVSNPFDGYVMKKFIVEA